MEGVDSDCESGSKKARRSGKRKKHVCETVPAVYLREAPGFRDVLQELSSQVIIPGCTGSFSGTKDS